MKKMLFPKKRGRIIVLLILLCTVCFYVLFFNVGLLLGLNRFEPDHITVRDGNDGSVMEIKEKDEFYLELKRAHVLYFYPAGTGRSGWSKAIHLDRGEKEISFTYSGSVIEKDNTIYVLSGSSSDRLSEYIWGSSLLQGEGGLMKNRGKSFILGRFKSFLIAF